MESYRVAICVIAFNEERNIDQLLNKIIDDKIKNSHIFVYTDGSTDKTAEIVSQLNNKYVDQLTHIKKPTRSGKRQAYNCLRNIIQDYNYVIFLDADIDFSSRKLLVLLNYLITNPQYRVVSPRLIPETKGFSGLAKRVANLYIKVRKHIYKFGRYRYFTGRVFITETKLLPTIPETSYADDFYLNLQYKPEEIGVCLKCFVKYYMPSTFWGIFWYSYRIGSYLADIKKNFKFLWREQMKRVSLTDYIGFGLTKFKFVEFWKELKISEKFVFLYSRAVTIVGFSLGFLLGKNSNNWKPISETKRGY